MRPRRRSRRGLTLIEVLLVLLILGMLATVAIVAFSGTREKARIDATKALLDQVKTALGMFESHMNRFPTPQEGLSALRSKPAFEEESEADKWAGPYLEREAKDMWDQALNYEPIEPDAPEYSQGLRYKLWSNGPDKQSGSEDDLKNWSEEELGT